MKLTLLMYEMIFFYNETNLTTDWYHWLDSFYVAYM